MLFKINDIEHFLFIDIETASIAPTYEELSTEWQDHWNKKHEALYRNSNTDLTPATSYPERAAIFGEFGRIICISCGFLRFDEKNQSEAFIKTFFDTDEKKVLEAFYDMAVKHFTKNSDAVHRFCGHNIKEFDLPYICRRLAAHSILPLKNPFVFYNKRPWDLPHVDTLELWKFGDQKNYTRLDLIASLLGIESPKGDLDGSKVGYCFHHEKDYDRIQRYCEADVKAVMNIINKLNGLPPIHTFNSRS